MQKASAGFETPERRIAVKNRYLIGILALAFLLCGCAGKEEKTGETETAPVSGRTVESSAEVTLGAAADSTDFVCTDLEGTTVTADLFADSRLTMVNVWATYCGPCLNEMQGLGELAGEYEPEDFQLVGIVSDVMEGTDSEGLDYLSEVIQKTGADYPHLLLNESLYNAMLTEVSVVPTTFFFDENGKLLDTVIGAKEKSDWKEIIDGFLEK